MPDGPEIRVPPAGLAGFDEEPGHVGAASADPRRRGLMSMAASVESANPVSGSPGVATPFVRAGERRKTRVVNYSRQLRVLPLIIER